MARRNYIFTNKKHSKKAIMSTVFGVLCIFSMVMVTYLSYKKAGNVPGGYGFTGLFVLVLSLVGLFLGSFSLREKDRFKFFPAMGIVLNTIALFWIGFIVYFGNYR